jgi:hypothetical protein
MAILIRIWLLHFRIWLGEEFKIHVTRMEILFYDFQMLWTNLCC